jgi:uncharacterized protein (DUF488 family)
MSAVPVALYTIGHSNHTLDYFVGLLKRHAIDCLADVRSAPASKYNPQFNHASLGATLPDHGIAYLFLGKELGARSSDPSCYVDGKVRYDRLAATALFQQGLDRVEKEAATRRLALMCAEKDPLDCHRMVLIARHFVQRGDEVQHILADGGLESHDDAVRRLRGQLGIANDDLFCSDDEMNALAYQMQERRVAYQAADEEAATRLTE